MPERVFYVASWPRARVCVCGCVRPRTAQRNRFATRAPWSVEFRVPRGCWQATQVFLSSSISFAYWLPTRWHGALALYLYVVPSPRETLECSGMGHLKFYGIMIASVTGKPVSSDPCPGALQMAHLSRFTRIPGDTVACSVVTLTGT